MKPLISIAIPAYNNEKYMQDCLNSVLNQSFQDFEIVVCDDHSTDATYDILMEYRQKHENIRVFRNERNLGVIPTRHKVIVNTVGEYITTLDHDDIYISGDKLKNEISLIRHFKEKYNKDIIAFSEIIIIDEKNETIRPQWDPSMIPRDFIFLREDYFRIGGFDMNLTLYEDWDLKIRLAHLREFYFTHSQGVGYRRAGDGASYSYSSLEHIKYLKEVFRKNISLIDENDRKECESLFATFIRKKEEKAASEQKKHSKSG